MVATGALSVSGAAAAVGSTEGTLRTADGRDRTYHLYVPPNLEPGTPVPLLVALHGGTGWGTQFEQNSGFDQLADRYGFIVVYPDGVGVGRNGTALRTWNGGGCCGPAARQEVDDVGFIRQLVEQLRTRALDRPHPGVRRRTLQRRDPRLPARVRGVRRDRRHRRAVELPRARPLPAGAAGVGDPHPRHRRPQPADRRRRRTEQRERRVVPRAARRRAHPCRRRRLRTRAHHHARSREPRREDHPLDVVRRRHRSSLRHREGRVARVDGSPDRGAAPGG